MPQRKQPRRDLSLLMAVTAVVAVVTTMAGSAASTNLGKIASIAHEKVHDATSPTKATGNGRAKAPEVPPATTTVPTPASDVASQPTTAPSAPSAPSAPPQAMAATDDAADGRPVRTVPRSIDATGGTDVTEQLESFIESVPDGSVIAFQEDGVYRIEGTVWVRDRHGLVFDGHGATFIADSRGDRTRSHWRFRSGSDITIRDMAIRGANPHAGTAEAAYVPSLEAQHGFDVGGVDGMLIERVRVTDVYGDFVYLGRGVDGWSRHVVIRDSHFERNGRQGIAITAAEDVLITNNFISHTRRATFDIEPNGDEWGAKDIRIVDNRIGPGRLLFLASVGSKYGPVSDVLVQGNVLSGRTLTVVARGGSEEGQPRRSNYRIIGNTSDTEFGSPRAAAMTFMAIDEVEVVGNTQPIQPGRDNAGVATTESCGVAVSGNTFANAVAPARIEPARCPASN